MQHHRIAIAALAALFGTAVTGSAIIAGSNQPIAAYADDNEQGDHGDGHDNGKHKGWHKHHRGDDENGQGDGRKNGSSLRGTIVSVNGATLGVQLSNGRTITVNDQAALNAGNVPNLYAGETVYLRGAYGQDGVFYANRVSIGGNNGGDNNGGYNNGGYNNGGYNNGGNCNVNVNGAVTIAGNERGGFSGSSFTLRQPYVSGVPIGTDYTILVNGSTCVQRALGTNGEHVTVVGIPVNGDPHTIQAIRITG